MAGQIAGATAAPRNTNRADALSKATEGLGKDEFLKLLLTELRYQDALDPVKDKEFIAQMAQFSTVEQITNMSNSFSSFFAESKKSDSLILLGKKVTSLDPETGESVEGTAESVKFEKDDPEIKIRLADGSFRVIKHSTVTGAETVTENEPSV